MTLLEVCVDSSAGLRRAIAGRADRLEVCARLDVGGLTPEGTFLSECLASGLPCMAMIRPRPGDFVYSEAEKSAMHADLDRVKASRAHGVVLGALTREGRVDREFVARLVTSARPLAVTFHRAFDVTDDPFAALEELVALRVDRVLTSGGAVDAHAGRWKLRELVAQARGRIIVLAGGGVRAHNAAEIVRDGDVSELHSSTVFERA